MYRRGKLPVGRLQSGFIALEEINAAFDRLADGGVLQADPAAERLAATAASAGSPWPANGRWGTIADHG